MIDAETMAADGADTIRGTARFLGLSERQTYRLIANGELDSLRAGTRVLVPRRSARDYIRRGLEQTRPSTTPSRVA